MVFSTQILHQDPKVPCDLVSCTFWTSFQGTIPYSHAVPILQGQEHDGPFATGRSSPRLISPFSLILHMASPYCPTSLSLNPTSRTATLSLHYYNTLYQKALLVSFIVLNIVFYCNVLFTCLLTPSLHCKFHEGRNIICLAPSIPRVCTE